MSKALDKIWPSLITTGRAALAIVFVQSGLACFPFTHMQFFPQFGPVVHVPGPNGARQAGTSMGMTAFGPAKETQRFLGRRERARVLRGGT
ncbi:MAG: hypothetical protein CMO44_19210 [Verrucomicrobiales bacterium]|nr:hypothetical protein [Verrucomicrobiales bacterium]